MALTFAEKQKWVATLEAIVNHSGKEERINKAVSMSFTNVYVKQSPASRPVIIIATFPYLSLSSPLFM